MYTGITRAKNFLILCGEPEEFKIGINRTDELERQTTLKDRLRKESTIENHEETEETSEVQERQSELIECGSTSPQKPKKHKLTMETILGIDPMIGMQGVTPYDFLEAMD